MKKIFFPLFMLGAILLGSFPVTVCADASIDNTVGGQFSKNIDNLLNEKGYSGTLLIIKNGKAFYQTSRGYSDFSSGVSNDKDTTYEIDSLQKAMTAGMIMKQVQDGHLKLSDKLAKFYPRIAGSEKITIRQMLDMTSGLILKTSVGPEEVMTDSDIIEDDINNIKFSNLLYNKWYYSPVNFNLLSGILEKITGKSYQELFTETYIKKLNLKHTIFAYNEDSGIHKATGYNNNNPLSAKLDYKNAFYTKRAFMFDELGTGQIYMSASDLYKVENYILTGSLLTDKSRKKLFKPGSSSTYGGGFYHGKDDNYANGWGYGFQTVVHLSNNGKDAVILLENYSRLAADAKPMAKKIYQMINN